MVKPLRQRARDWAPIFAKHLPDPRPTEARLDRWDEWIQATKAKGDGQRVIALLEAIEDWMAVCHQQETEIERLEALPDPRPTEAEVRSAVNQDRDLFLLDESHLRVLRSLGCFRPEPAAEPSQIECLE